MERVDDYKTEKGNWRGSDRTVPYFDGRSSYSSECIYQNSKNHMLEGGNFVVHILYVNKNYNLDIKSKVHLISFNVYEKLMVAHNLF